MGADPIVKSRFMTTLRARGVCRRIPHSFSACAFLRSCLGRILYHFHLAQGHSQVTKLPITPSQPLAKNIDRKTRPVREQYLSTCTTQKPTYFGEVSSSSRRRRTPRPPPSTRQRIFQLSPSFLTRGTSHMRICDAPPLLSKQLLTCLRKIISCRMVLWMVRFHC